MAKSAWMEKLGWEMAHFSLTLSLRSCFSPSEEV